MNLPSSEQIPFVIGLTGAIGSGKTLVRKMLEHKGALTIDADQIAHKAYAKDSRGYQSVVSHFGHKILDKNGEIDRIVLGSLVFSDSQALDDLESLIHPLVSQAVNKVISLSPLPIIVVEGIKLMESDLKDHCDEIWVVNSPIDQVYERLANTRAMTSAQVNGRLQNQRLLLEGNSGAAITNDGTIEDLQRQVNSHWENLAGHSSHFYAALATTGQILSPFEDYLLSPEAAATSGFFPKTINAWHYFLWHPITSLETDVYFPSSIDHFTAICETAASKIAPNLFSDCLIMMEQFFRLHLCETLMIICSSADEQTIRQQGFEQCAESSTQPLHPYPLGYNHLCRQLLPPLELFRET